ncbi:MAG: cytochrome c peroxidase [Bacteroidota bacterium]
MGRAAVAPYLYVQLIILLGLMCYGCTPVNEGEVGAVASTPIVYDPPVYADIIYPVDNPTTEEGLALGKMLFFDPILSVDSTISCASCHEPALAFTDGEAISRGIDGRLGRRNAPTLTNIGYRFETLFWDGRAVDLETQALHPIADPNEMGGNWPLIISRLRKHEVYSEALQKAFGLASIRDINPDHIGKALAQFQRSLISNNSKYDRVKRGDARFTEMEARGHAIFFDEADFAEVNAPVGECAHCHTAPHFTNQRFFNNGLDEALALEDFVDKGRGAVTGNKYENGLFRTPTLRNIALTAPYMHDGRFETLEQVIEHYNQGGHYAENRNANVRPLGLTEGDQQALLAFLNTLTDSSFVSNPIYQMP